MARSYALISILFVAAITATNPLGDFPLNDDWSYGTAVRTLLQQGRLQLHPWTSMPLLTQILWGTLFCLPKGFSFSALRISTLVLSLAGLLSLTALARRCSAHNHLLPLAPLLLFCNPVFLGLSHTFMTDVPFLTLALLAILLLHAGVHRPVFFIPGALVAVAATLLRQSGVLIPAALTIALLIRKEARRQLMLPALLTVVCVVSLFAYELLMRSADGLGSGYNIQYLRAFAQPNQGEFHHQLAANVAATLIYTGIFLLPINLLLLTSIRPARLILSALLAAAVLAAVHFGALRLPGNILSDRGLGPFQLPTGEAFTAFSTNPVSRFVFGLLAFAGIVLLIEALYQCAKHFRDNVTNSTLLTLAALYFVSILPVPQFDRYMLIYVPLLALPLTSIARTDRRWLWGTWVLVVLYGLFSVAATHDYLAWNRARWRGLRLLTHEMSIPPERIDGGFEFNGLFTFSESYERRAGKSRWWVEDDEYKVSLDSLPGHELVAKYRTGTWLPLAPRNIFVLRRRDIGI